jgi:hypothetical protein
MVDVMVAVAVEVAVTITVEVTVSVAEEADTAVDVRVALTMGVGVTVTVPFICWVFVCTGAAGDDGGFFLHEAMTSENNRTSNKRIFEKYVEFLVFIKNLPINIINPIYISIIMEMYA